MLGAPMKLSEIVSYKKPRRRTYHFRIRYGNNTIGTGFFAKDRYEAEWLLQKQYPGAIILSIS